MFVCQMKFSESGFLSLKQLHCNSAYLPLTQYLALKASPSGIYSTLHRHQPLATQRCLTCQQGSKFISKDQSLLPLYTILNQSEGKGTDRKNQDLNKFHPALIMLCLLFSKGQDLQYLQPPLLLFTHTHGCSLPLVFGPSFTMNAVLTNVQSVEDFSAFLHSIINCPWLSFSPKPLSCVTKWAGEQFLLPEASKK